jgi:hypothetical protein
MENRSKKRYAAHKRSAFGGNCICRKGEERNPIWKTRTITATSRIIRTRTTRTRTTTRTTTATSRTTRTTISRTRIARITRTETRDKHPTPREAARQKGSAGFFESLRFFAII